ncbi:polysaccharide pyruvyl transferase family protein [Agromyces sp. MMS24-K17]|uniref:polysaccharide pyruvyl transferase family protein n=1 Tax=Agromyces sp. MMS24-K17 TaxID=3372850 RepID=UPI003754E233
MFASAAGQYDNVGDTVLRRGYLDALRQVGPLNVYVGSRDDDHLSGLGLKPDDRVIRTSAEWRSRVSRAMTSERTLYAFDTGETEARRPFALRYLRLAPLLVASRLRGGRAAHVGVGVRESTAWRLPISAVLRLCSVVTWRDESSRDMMRVGTVTPDWAFALGAPDDVLVGAADDPERTKLAIAVRASLSHATRERPDERWIEAVRRIAEATGLEPVVVAQIERDGPLALEIAEALGAEAVVWEGPNHAKQEARLRAAYRRSRAVLSDRLHAVVIAATEGAVPLGLVTGPDDKVARTLAGAGILGTGIDRALDDPEVAIATAQAAIARQDEIMAHVIDARRRIDGLTEALVGLSAKAKG